MTTADPQFDGVYGPFTITAADRAEVQRYRFSLLISGIALSAGLLQWWLIGDQWAWVWLVPLCIGLGLALQWIHIYLRPLHQTLQVFWLMGCLGSIPTPRFSRASRQRRSRPSSSLMPTLPPPSGM